MILINPEGLLWLAALLRQATGAVVGIEYNGCIWPYEPTVPYTAFFAYATDEFGRLGWGFIVWDNRSLDHPAVNMYAILEHEAMTEAVNRLNEFADLDKETQ